ncbi:MAG: hypothetical protein QNJ55_26850, partial [Xenococcus sp. MO_188.B8]|nr:hypothetical protein [Xenococcus sp. MO_188.B8]
MSLCPDLATKQQLAALEKETERELEQKVATSAVPNIIGQALAGVSSIVAVKTLGIQQAVTQNKSAIKNAAVSVGQNAASLANVKSAVNTNAVNIGNANAQALNATLAAKKANYQNLYTASRAASNANRIATVGKQALRALNLIANIYSILSSFATTTALAYLTKQVAALNKAVILNTKKIEQNRIRSVENSLINGRQQSQIDTINQANRIRDIQHRELAYQVGLQQAQIAKNTSDIAAFKASTEQQVESLKKQYQGQIDSLIKTNSDLQQKITKSNSDIQKINSQIKDNNLKFEALEQRVNSQVKDLEKVNSENLEKLVEKQVNKEVNENVKIRNLNDKVTNYDLDIQGLKSNSKDLESSIKARDLEVIKQAKDLEKRVNEIKNNEVKIETLVDQIIPQDNQVDQKQVQDINNKLDKLDNKISRLPDPATIALAVGGLDILRQIKQNGLKSTCQAPSLVPPVAAQAKANGATTLKLQAVNTAQNAAIQKTVNVVQKTTTVTNKIVSHGTYGLKAIKNAADIAWKATHADKALQMLNTVLLVNNAIFLGSNIADTVGDTASLVLSSLGIKDSQGQAINVNQVIGNTVKNWIVGIVGQANYTAYEQKIKSRIRTYQATANLYSSVRSMFASAEDIAEETGINVAHIGNALRDSHTVEADSYSYMPEGKRRINKVFNALENADEKADSLNRITRDITDITEEAVQFNQDRIEFKNLLNNERKSEIRKTEREANRIESLPNIQEQDKLE